MDTIKKTIYISPEANNWLTKRRNQSEIIDKLILEQIKNENNNMQSISKEYILKIIDEYLKNNIIEVNKNKKISNKAIDTAKGLINF